MVIALVQATSKIITGASSTTLAFTNPVAAGNFITTTQAGFVGGGSPNSTPTTPTDTLGHTYSGARAAYSPVSAASTGRAFYVPTIPSGGANTVTMGMAASGDFSIGIAEWSGGDATPLAAGTEQNEATGTGTNVNVGSTGARASSDGMLLAWFTHLGNDTTIAEDAADGFNLLSENEGGSSNMPLASQYKITSNTTAVTPNWTLGASRQWFGQVVSFEAAAGGGGGGTFAKLAGERFGLAGGRGLAG